MKCAARGCEEAHKPGQIMCRRHWFMVPDYIRAKVWEAYRDGDRRASAFAIREAIESIPKS
jgi:hypothetical protein